MYPIPWPAFFIRNSIVFDLTAANPRTPYFPTNDNRAIERRLPAPSPLFFLGLGGVLTIFWAVCLVWLALSAIVSIGTAFGAWIK
jgi:hypothetical protein